MLIREQTGTNVTYYLYDENGSAIGFEYNGTPYFYLKNIQGDVLSIVDNSGVVVVNYTYNAWGEIISTTGTLASTIGAINKLRYRSYYYDTETGFYYLQSRYYDPIVKRFISPDSCLGVNEDIHTYNLYIYCGNNPIINADYSGQVTIKVAGIALAVTYACVTVAKSAYNYIKNGSYSFARGKYIDSQSSGNASKMRMGFWKGDYNGCGWIATFNALVMVGDYVHPKKIIQAYELTYGAMSSILSNRASHFYSDTTQTDVTFVASVFYCLQRTTLSTDIFVKFIFV